jgi:hypothetical protein
MGRNSEGRLETAQTYIALRAKETFDIFTKGEYIFIVAEKRFGHELTSKCAAYGTTRINEAKLFDTEEEAQAYLHHGPFEMVQVTMAVSPLPDGDRRASQKMEDAYNK